MEAAETVREQASLHRVIAGNVFALLGRHRVSQEKLAAYIGMSADSARDVSA